VAWNGRADRIDLSGSKLQTAAFFVRRCQSPTVRTSEVGSCSEAPNGSPE
jgi:hypothetical protein